MKSATPSVSRTTNTDETEGVRGEIVPEAMGIVMEILSKMYTNGPRAVLREYACNGWDAHVEAGNSRPIEVTLPTNLMPSLLIRDFGTGLDKEGVLRTFLKYGVSTKRDSNEQVGRFGIGSKSAYVMTNTFIVTGVKDGQRTVVEFTLDADHVATAFVKREGTTTEPNGVSVSMGVDDVERMHREASSFFSTWEPGRVLVDGEEPSLVWATGQALSENIHVVPDSDGSVNVVMGQVAYPADRSLLRKVADSLVNTPARPMAEALASWQDETAIYFKVDLGTVDIAPNREGLRDTAATTQALANRISEMVDSISTSVQAAVDAAPSKYAAAHALSDAIANLGAFKVQREVFPYKGEALTYQVTLKDVQNLHLSSEYRYRQGSVTVVGVQDGATLDTDKTETTVVVVNPNVDDLGKVKRYAKRFLEDSEYSRIIVVQQPTGEQGWFQWGTPDGATTWTLEEYRAALKAMRASNPSLRNAPAYSTGWNTYAAKDRDYRTLFSDIVEDVEDADVPVVIYHERSWADSFSLEIMKPLAYPIVLLGNQSEKALLKHLDAAGIEVVTQRSLTDKVEEAAKAVLATFTDDEKLAFAASQWVENTRRFNSSVRLWREWAAALEGEEIKHPGFAAVEDEIALAELVAADLDHARETLLEAAASATGVDLDIPEYEAEIPRFKGTFPLLRGVNTYHLRADADLKAEVVKYINSKA